MASTKKNEKKPLPLLDPQHAQRVLATVRPQLAEVERHWQEHRSQYTLSETEKRFESWLASMRARFAQEAAADFEAQQPRPTFAALADRHLKQSIPQDDVRARVVEALAELNSAKDDDQAATDERDARARAAAIGTGPNDRYAGKETAR